MYSRMRRRWNYYNMDQVRALTKTTTSESIWNDAMESPFMVTSDALVGKKLRIAQDDGISWVYEFQDEHHLTWISSAGYKGSARYTASPAPGYDNVFVLQHSRERYDVPTATTAVLDFDSGNVVLFDAHLGLPDAPREVERVISFGTIAGVPNEQGIPKPEYTQDLIGKACYWKHDPNSRGIKYIFSCPLYLSYIMYRPNSPMVWMASHPCDYIKVRENLYIASTIEERQGGFQLFMLMNFETMTDVQAGFGLGNPEPLVDRMEMFIRSGRHAEWTDIPTFFD